MSYAQESSDTVQIFFRQGRTELDEYYMGNKRALEEFKQRAIRLYQMPGHKPYRVSIISGASPEGQSAQNDKLSQARADVIRRYLIAHTPQLPEYMFVIKSAGEDWDGLLSLVEQTEHVPMRTEVLYILRTTPVWVKKNGKVVDGKKRQLQNLGGGYPWKWMLENLFPRLRRSTAQVDYRLNELPIAQQQSAPPPQSVPPLQPAPAPQPIVPQPPTSSSPQVQNIEINIFYMGNRDTVYVQLPDTIQRVVSPPSVIPDHVVPFRERPVVQDSTSFRLALKTNMLYLLAAVPNIGVEYAINDHWSAAAYWMYSWWHSDKWHWYWRTYGGDIAIRRWWGGSERHLTGHHLGLYGQIVTYDFELGKRGYLGDRWTYGGGIEYGYARRIGKRLNLDLTLGVGYLRGEYKEYLPIDGCYVWQATKMRNWMGPTKLEVSLVWLLGNINRNGKGGEDR